MYFHDADHVFISIACEIICIEPRGKHPIGSIRTIGDPVRNEQRQTQRVDADGADISVQVQVSGENAQVLQGEVLNISGNGIRIVVDRGDLAAADWVDLTLAYDGQEIPGRMQVQNRCTRGDGRVRYGLMSDQKDGQLLSELARITQDLQDRHAQQGQGAATNPSDDLAHDNGQDQQDPPQPRRAHERRPWPGIAKVYLREGKNLRVLDIHTIDLSSGGLSFACPSYIYDSSELLIEKPVPGGFFRIRGAIRSCQISGSGTYRVGMQFLGAPLKPWDSAPELEPLRVPA